MTDWRKEKVVVFLGGNSREREVSLRSGASVLSAFASKKIEAHPFDPKEGDFSCFLPKGGQSFTRAFIALHGKGGEDGVIQGFCQALGLAYTGSGVAASALAMDKALAKLVFRDAGVPTPEGVAVESDDEEKALELAMDLGFPLAVKPAREGSTLGVTLVDGEKDFFAAWNKARDFDTKVLLEKRIKGAELHAAILGKEVLPLVRVLPKTGFYDYDAKYTPGKTDYFCPSGLDAEKERLVGQTAMDAFLALGCQGWGRVDIILTENGPRVLEVNTIPGMTKTSLVPMAARARGLDFADLVLEIASRAGEDF